jgi:hypothetical protein
VKTDRERGRERQKERHRERLREREREIERERDIHTAQRGSTNRKRCDKYKLNLNFLIDL